MAVITTQGGGLLGTLGPLASIGGLLTGQPWLSALGTGMTAANAAMSGNTQGALSQVLAGIANGAWSNPADGNIAQTPYQASVEELKKMHRLQQQLGQTGQMGQMGGW